MIHFRIVSVFISILFSFVLIAAPETIPPAQVIESKLPSVDTSFAEMNVSHDFKSPDKNSHGGVDLLAWEKQQMLDFINGTGNFSELKGIPGSRKMLINKRYSVGDPQIAQILIEAARHGFAEVHHMTDANTFMKAKFEEGESHHTRFEKDFINPKSESGSLILDLLSGGFSFNGKKYGIWSQPLFNPKKHPMIPIMHEKILLMVVNNAAGKPERVYAIYGTANQTPNERYNRIIRIDPNSTEVGNYFLEQTRNMQAAFAQGKTTAEMKSLPPLRVTYQDGSFQEALFTDGKYNPNQRIAELLNRAVEKPTELKIEEVIFSHFVFTNSQVFKSLKAAMQTHTNMKVRGVLDDKFISPEGFGLAAALVGFIVDRPMGLPVYAFPFDLRKRLELYAYQRASLGKDGKPLPDFDPDGPPTNRHVWHDKTTIIRVEENGEKFIYVFTGSFNNSNHFDNAEIQMMYKFRAESPVAQAFIASVVDPMLSEKEYSIPLELAVFRNALASYTAHSVLDIAVDKAQEILTLVNTHKIGEALSRIHEVYRLPNQIKHELQITPTEFAKRLKRLTNFLKFYKELPEFENIYAQKVMAVALIFVGKSAGKENESEKDKGYRAKDIRQVLDFVFYRSDVAEERREEIMKKAWEILEIDLPYPVITKKPAQADVQHSQRAASVVTRISFGSPLSTACGSALDEMSRPAPETSAPEMIRREPGWYGL